jgi:hypothetical protein
MVGKNYNTGNVVLDRFIDIWVSNPYRYMWGVPLSLLTKRVGEDSLQYFPEILRLAPSETGVLVKIDTRHFPCLFRGTVGVDRRRGENSISTPELIGKYIEEGYLTYGRASYGYGLYTTKDPLVAFSSDRWGSFSSPRGSIIFIDKSVIHEVKTATSEDEYGKPREGIEEVIFKGKVPLDKVVGMYLHKEDADEIIRKYGNSRAFGKPLKKSCTRIYMILKENSEEMVY